MCNEGVAIMKKKHIYISVLILICIILIVIIRFSMSSANVEFSSEAWKKDPDHRIELYDDLQKKKILDKKSKNDIIKILGNPESSDTGYMYDNFIDY
ncbi:MAG: hypothetical protein V2A54_16875, partial [Bacteroidota bacterium]